MSLDGYDFLVKELKKRGICHFEYVPIKTLSTMLVESFARLLIYPKTIEQLNFAIQKTKGSCLKYYVISGGSNTLFCKDLVGSVIISTRKMVGIFDTEEGVEIYSGTTSGEAIAYLAKKNLSAMESFVGVPSRIGGMVAMNFGCYNTEIKDIIKSVTAITEKGVEKLSAKDCDFSYRHSRFQKGEVVISCEIKTVFDKTVRTKAQNVLKKRKASQPLNMPTLGCIFKSDVMSVGSAIEILGLKGKSVGGARISYKHGGFIENTGKATFEDVLKLMDIVEEKVYNKLCIRLITEIKKVF